MKKTVPVAGQKCESTRKVAEALGGGEARLYNIRDTPLPDVVKPPPEKLVAMCDWFIVHFPSRRWRGVLPGRAEGLRLLKNLEKGKDESGLCPAKRVKKVVPARARVGVCDPSSAKGGETKKVPQLTAIPKDMDFDRGMKHAFPTQRIVNEIEMLLRAEDEVVDREGNVLGSKPAWMVRKEALKLCIEHAQGRAGEKPPPPPDKKKISYDDLEGMLRNSPATRRVIRGLIEKFETPSAPRPDGVTEDEPAKAGTTLLPEGGK